MVGAIGAWPIGGELPPKPDTPLPDHIGVAERIISSLSYLFDIVC